MPDRDSDARTDGDARIDGLPLQEPGSPCYQNDSEGYRVSGEGPLPRGSDESGEEVPEEDWREGVRKSRDELRAKGMPEERLRELTILAGEEVVPPKEKPHRSRPAGGWLPGTTLAEEAQTERQQQRKVYRVGIRLSWSQHSKLENAAKLYGVAPTTLARMLINRGAEAIVNSYRREELLGFDAE
jgi:hypothetical protein